ncbi:TPA: hypothetical protein HMS99_22910 [Escherichia coli]|nr:hypothetical protein [Escherichia coli]HAJ2768409.1 hypothetical protein [Escherichia coli]HBY2502828.1 hypothetical protein [Klebsiella pneumoniae]HBY2514153.1 hypothetical protein [Klebsiella pneumoniae]
MSTIHLITTCAKKKAGPVHDTVFPYHTTDTEWICPYISRHLLSLNPLQARCRRYSRGER